MLMFLFTTSCYTLFVMLNMKNDNVYSNAFSLININNKV